MKQVLFAMMLVAALTAKASVAAENSDPAQRLFQQGVEAAQHGEWDRARAAFQDAFTLSSRPVIVVNLAGAQTRTGRLVEAARNYQALADDKSPEAAPFREAAVGVLRTLQPRIPRIRVRTAGLSGDDVVWVDDRDLDRDALASPVMVNPGPHTVSVSRDGTERARVTVSVIEGETHDVSLPAAVPARPPAPNPPTALALVVPPDGNPGSVPWTSREESTRESRAPSTRSWWRSPWLWTAVATVAGAATAAIVLTAREPAPAFSGTVPPGIIHVQ